MRGVILAMLVAVAMAAGSVNAALASVADVKLGADGTLYVTKKDATFRGRPLAVSIADSPGSVASVPASSRDGAGTGDGARRWITVVAAIALAVGLALRFAAGRRLRRDVREGDEDPPA
jgi:hypothetical protein